MPGPFVRNGAAMAAPGRGPDEKHAPRRAGQWSAHASAARTLPPATPASAALLSGRESWRPCAPTNLRRPGGGREEGAGRLTAAVGLRAVSRDVTPTPRWPGATRPTVSGRDGNRVSLSSPGSLPHALLTYKDVTVSTETKTRSLLYLKF